MDVVYYVKKEYVLILSNVLYLVILVPMFNAIKMLKYYVIVEKILKLFLVLMNQKLNFHVEKFAIDH